MTQFSWPWECENTGDGGSNSLTLDVLQLTTMFPGVAEPTTMGVVYWTDSTAVSTLASGSQFSGITGTITGLLAPTNPSGSVVRIASGVGVVGGWLYVNDANVDFDISADLGNASATDIIVLQKDRTNQQVRLARIKGGAGATATVTQNSDIWEVKLAEVALTAGGDFSSLTDTRSFIISPFAGTVKLRETVADGTSGTVTFSAIQGDLTHLLVLATYRSSQASLSEPGTIRLNGDSAANYATLRYVFADGVAFANPAFSAARTSFSLDVSGATAGADKFDYLEMRILDYANATTQKSCTVKDITRGAGGSYPETQIHDGWYESTSAVTSIEIAADAGNFVSGSKFTLYGIR